MKNKTVSACIITKNEENCIKDCLVSLEGAVDEVVVVDTGSDDKTVEICQEHGARVFDFEWNDNFAAARNYAIDKARMDWVLIIDADEKLLPGQENKLRELINDVKVDAYDIKIINRIGDFNITTKRVSLFKNTPQFRFQRRVHEQVIFNIIENNGIIKSGNITLEHFGYDPEIRANKQKFLRNLTLLKRELEEKEDSYTYYCIAQEYFGMGDYHEAVEHYKNAIAKCTQKVPPPYFPNSVYMLARSFIYLNELEAAETLFNRFKVILPDFTDLRFLEAVAAKNQGKFDKARKLFYQCLSMGDSSTDKYHYVHEGCGSYRAWYELAELYKERNDIKEAFNCYLEAIKIKNDFLPAIKEALKMALKTDPAEEVKVFFSNYLDLSSFAVIEVLWDNFFNQRYFKIAKDILDYFNEDQLIQAQKEKYKLMQALTLMGLKEFSLAIEEFNDLLDNEYEKRALKELILCYLMKEDYNEAEEFNERYSGYDSIGSEVLFKLISKLKDESQFSNEVDFFASDFIWDIIKEAIFFEFIELLDELVELYESSGEPRLQIEFKLGKLLYSQGYTEIGTEYLIKACNAGVYDAESYYYLAEACENKGLIEDALLFLEEAYALETDNNLKVQYSLKQSRLLAERGQVAEALRVIEEAEDMFGEKTNYLLEWQKGVLEGLSS
jgi:glycosyltransferase involved in cell wall biosynthesis